MSESCDRCGADIIYGGFCSDRECSIAFSVAVDDLEEWLEEPEQEELSNMFFDNSGNSPAAVWWVTLERPRLLMERWQTHFDQAQVEQL